LPGASRGVPRSTQFCNTGCEKSLA
jgi:hypothetical protein